MTLMTAAHLRNTFIAINNDGGGFAPERGAEDCASAAAAIAGDTGKILHFATSDDDVFIVRTPSDRIIAIGDASGAWCCDVTDDFNALS